MGRNPYAALSATRSDWALRRVSTVFEELDASAEYAARRRPITPQASPDSSVATLPSVGTFAALDGDCHARVMPPENTEIWRPT